MASGERERHRPEVWASTAIAASFVLKDGKPWLGSGSPGLPAQPITEVLVNIFDFGMNPKDAADAPRFWAYRDRGVSRDFGNLAWVERILLQCSATFLSRVLVVTDRRASCFAALSVAASIRVPIAVPSMDAPRKARIGDPDVDTTANSCPARALVRRRLRPGHAVGGAGLHSGRYG